MKLKNSKFLTSNWVITLTATLIGVFGALFLNEWVVSKNVKNQKSIAVKNILIEIEENKTKIEKSLKKHKTFIGTLLFMEKNMDKENRLITDVESLQAFRTDFPNVFTAQDSTLLENGKYHYKGNMDLNFDLSHVNLTNIAWNTLKHNSLANSFGFDCLMFLEQMANITEETLKQERILLNLMKDQNRNEADDYEERMKDELMFLIEFEKALLEAYNYSEEKLSDCR